VAECHSHTKGAFCTPRHFCCTRKAVGLTGNRAESKRASSCRLDLLCFSCCMRRATEYHNNERRALHISRHLHLAKTRPEVVRVLEVILGRILSNQSLRFSLIALWSTNQPRLHEAKIPIGVATNACDEWGDAHTCCTLWPFCS